MNPTPEQITPELIGEAIRVAAENSPVSHLAAPERGSAEWTEMWTVLWYNYDAPTLANGQIDYAMKCPDTGECWQYMGSYVVKNTGEQFHEFRHRNYKGRRTYCQLATEYDTSRWEVQL